VIKFEYRNPKSETNSKMKNPKERLQNHVAGVRGLSAISNFDIVSDFDIRVSDL